MRIDEFLSMFRRSELDMHTANGMMRRNQLVIIDPLCTN